MPRLETGDDWPEKFGLETKHLIIHISTSQTTHKGQKLPKRLEPGNGGKNSAMRDSRSRREFLESAMTHLQTPP